jgi:hypothetical protein
MSHDELLQMNSEMLSAVASAMLPVLCVLFLLYIFESDINKLQQKSKRAKEGCEERKLIAQRAATEITVRNAFESWLTDEVIRMQIECAAYPQDHDRAEALAEVETAKNNNAVRIVKLHSDYTKLSAPGDVEQQWAKLRLKFRPRETANESKNN